MLLEYLFMSDTSIFTLIQQLCRSARQNQLGSQTLWVDTLTYLELQGFNFTSRGRYSPSFFFGQALAVWQAVGCFDGTSWDR